MEQNSFINGCDKKLLITNHPTGGFDAANYLGGWQTVLSSQVHYSDGNYPLLVQGAKALSGWKNARGVVYPPRLEPVYETFSVQVIELLSLK